MGHAYHSPREPIATYVRTTLVVDDGHSPADLPLFTNHLPVFVCKMRMTGGGRNEVLHLKLFGKGAEADFFRAGEGEMMVAYFFKPFALPVTFGVEAGCVAGAPVDLRQWSAHKSNALMTQLLSSLSEVATRETLDEFISQQIRTNQRECEIVRLATDRIMMDPSPDVLNRVQHDLRVSERSLQRIFRKYVGVSPTQYRRICQFQGSFSQLRSGNFENLTDVAFDMGFADQSHFIRSFKEFAATTPDHYLKAGLEEKKP